MAEKDRAGSRNSGGGTRPRGRAEPEAAAGRLRTWEGCVKPSELAARPGLRVDVYLAECAEVLSRSQLKARGAVITVNGTKVKPSRLLKSGDRIGLEWVEEPSPTLVPEDIALSILYEDGRCLVVDKAQGMVTHPGHGNRRGTLANAVLGRLEASDVPRAAASPAPARAGIVHRLDKDTSGLLIVAKDAEAQAFLAAQFKARTTRKEYVAVVRGLPHSERGRIADHLGRDRNDRKKFAPCTEGGKPAVTDYRVLRIWKVASGSSRASGPEGYALVSLHPRTGRTHQLRIHMAGLGTPILGDPIYGKRDPRFPEATLMLHAYRLSIVLPGELEARSFCAPVPERIRTLLEELREAFGPGFAIAE